MRSGAALPSSGLTERLIGRIYDDVEAQAPWRGTLADLCDALSAQTLVLQKTVSGRADRTYFLAAGVRTSEAHIREWERRSLEQQNSLALPPGRVLTCNDYLAEPQRDGFVEMIRRYDVARGMSAAILALDGADFSLHALRPGRARPFGSAEEALVAALAPHLARAIRLRARLAVAGRQEALFAAALDKAGIGLLTVDGTERVQAANDRAYALLRAGGLRIEGGRLGAADRELARALRAALRDAVAAEGEAGFARALRLAGGGAVLVRSTPLEDRTIGRRTGGATLLLTGPLRAVPQAAAGHLQALFGLTATEAAVARHLADGREPTEIQALLGIRYTTLRTHVGALFAKLGCARQAELIRRLAALAPLLS